MRIYISVDMEGIAGVVDVDQSRRTGSDYQRARAWMTREVSAAVAGAFDGGAKSVLVNDSHGDMRNLLFEDLDKRAEILSGEVKTLSMVHGVDAGFDAAYFVGYHAGASTLAGVLDHTYHGRIVHELRLGGRLVGETAINALVAGAHGVPVALVTGDDVTCRQARETLGDIETVAVKSSVSRFAARSLHPEEACRRIHDGAKAAIARIPTLKPYRMAPPLRLEVSFLHSAMADMAELLPDTKRVDAVRCSYEAGDPELMLRVLLVWIQLAVAAILPP